MQVDELLSYCDQHNLPQPLKDFITHSDTHLCLFGGQHCMFKQRVTDEMLAEICTVIKQHPTEDLVLDLGCNELTDKSVETLADLFAAKRVVGLSLRGNRLTWECGDDLYKLIVGSQLRYLSLAQNALGEATESVMMAVHHSPALHYGLLAEDVSQATGTLRYLDLQQTGFTEAANVYLEQFLQSRFCGLRELQLAEVRFNADSHGVNGFHRLARGLRYNTTLRALTVRGCPQLDDECLRLLLEALDAEVATQNMFEHQLDELRRLGLQRLHGRVTQMQKLQQRNLRAVGYPPPLQRRATCPLRYLDLSKNEALSFDCCGLIAAHLASECCVLKVLVLDGVKVRNQGVNALSQALLRYQPSDDPAVEADHYDYFGCPCGEDDKPGYDASYQNVTAAQLRGSCGAEKGIVLSLQRAQIGGQGLCTLALLVKLNRQVCYVGLQGNNLELEIGVTANEQTVWHPMIEWELTFSVRQQTGMPVYCDFGLERSELEKGHLQFYKRPQKVIRAMWVFE